MTHHQENTSLRGVERRSNPLPQADSNRRSRLAPRRSTAEGSNKKTGVCRFMDCRVGLRPSRSDRAGLTPRGSLFEVHPIHDVGVGLVADNEFFEQATDGFDVVVVGGDAQGA